MSSHWRAIREAKMNAMMLGSSAHAPTRVSDVGPLRACQFVTCRPPQGSEGHHYKAVLTGMDEWQLVQLVTGPPCCHPEGTGPVICHHKLRDKPMIEVLSRSPLFSY